jgi:hypothetical protein
VDCKDRVRREVALPCGRGGQRQRRREQREVLLRVGARAVSQSSPEAFPAIATRSPRRERIRSSRLLGLLRLDRHLWGMSGASVGRVIGLGGRIGNAGVRRLVSFLVPVIDVGYEPGFVPGVAAGPVAAFGSPAARWTDPTTAGSLAWDRAGGRLVSAAVVPARGEVLVTLGKAISIESPPRGLVRAVMTAPWAVAMASTMESPRPWPVLW